MNDTTMIRRSITTAHVFVCCNRRPDGHPRGCCAAKGSEKLRDYMKVRAKELGLSQACGSTWPAASTAASRGPAWSIYPEGVWYTHRRRRGCRCRAGTAMSCAASALPSD